MEYNKKNNNDNQLINFKRNIFLKTTPNKDLPNKSKTIKFNLNNKNNSKHKNTKSFSNLHSIKNIKNKKDIFKNNYMEKKNQNQKIESQKKKLETIDLYEKNTKNIYDWNILLNNPLLGIYYDKNEYKKLEVNNEKKEKKSNFPKYPIVLLDLSENHVKKIFGIKKIFLRGNNKLSSSHNKKKLNSPISSSNSIRESKQKLSQKRAMTEIINDFKKKESTYHNIRPRSIYSIRKPEETFYFSNDFNDYYKEDLKTFSEKMTLLKPRIKASNLKLKKEILRQRFKSLKEEKKLAEVINNVNHQNIKFKKLDLIIAGERKNVEPLLKNIYYQENPHLKRKLEHMKLYYKTMKPYGNNNDNIDYNKNERWRPSNEIKALREKHQKKYNNVGTSMDNDNSNLIKNRNNNLNYFKNNSNLILSYYDKDDPDIKYFNNLINKKCKNENNFFYDLNTLNSNNDDDKVKEKMYFSDIQNKKNIIKSIKDMKKELTKKDFSKFPFIIEQYKQYTNSNQNINQDKEKKLNNNIYNNNKYFMTETTKNTLNSLYSV